MTEASASDTSRAILERGYALVPGLYRDDELRAFCDALDELRARFAATVLTSPEPMWLADNVEVAGPGLAIYQLLGFVPSLAPSLFKPEIIATLRGLLGEDLHLELVGAVMSDETRPFTEWESHLGGIDDERWRQAAHRPRQTDVRRVVHMLLLEDLDADTGAWRVLPRAVGDPVDPPASTQQLDWPGQTTLSCAAGTVLLLEESVWHAVVPRKVPGVRRFIGAYFASSTAEPTEGRDRSLDRLAADDATDAAFAELLAHRPR